MKTQINRTYDIVVVGGGVSGVCAAIAAARHGAKTALVQNRPVLGGNASSEIRMHICGADCHGSRPNARETGLLEEILLDTRKRNPLNNFSMLDITLWEKTRFQPGLDLYLNTHVNGVAMDNATIIRAVTAEQITTETSFLLEAKIFIDATGDGMLAALSAAQYAAGREGKQVYGEHYAPDESDQVTMGSTILFKAVDTGHPVPFEKPAWANTYKEEDLRRRDHSELTAGYWWIELGGDELDIISDGEILRDELLKAAFGVWDHIKNGGEHAAAHYALEWVGFLPGKRESRRVIGEYVLREQDCLSGRRFPDAVAYGGWPMDIHTTGGLRDNGEPTLYIHLPEVYTIPYRSLYSINIQNLMLGGRNISVSRMAFGSTRVMATCAVAGQAAGTAAAMAVRYGEIPSAIGKRITELQQTLLRDDAWIPGVVNADEADLARNATVDCSSQTPEGEAVNVINGIARKTVEGENRWISAPLTENGEWIALTLPRAVLVREVHLKFDSNLSREIMVTLSDRAFSKQHPGIPPELVKDYTLSFFKGETLVSEQRFTNNHQRFVRHCFAEKICCDRIKLHVCATNGDERAKVFEIRVYEDTL